MNPVNLDQKSTPTKKRRPDIPQKTKKLLQKEINSICPFAFCSSEDVDHFQFHHIDGDTENNDPTNLLMLCPTCHSKITKGDISKEEVIQVKKSITLKKNKEEITQDKVQTITQINYGDKNIQINNPGHFEFNQNTTKVVRNVVQPTEAHITEAQCVIVKKLIEDIAEIEYTVAKTKKTKATYFRNSWGRLYKMFKVTSY